MSTSYSYLPPWTNLSKEALPKKADAVEALAHSDLISFLAVAQHYDVDILPNTWQPARGDLGRGGEAYIRQSFVQLDVGLAFRALRVFYNEPTDLAVQQQISQAFNAMMTEISILSQPLVQQSPNVVNLGGITWSVESDSVWPVLVYTRGTPLRQYLLECCEKPLDLKEKLNICFGICSGGSALHQSGVVHGDLKPQNIIMTRIAKQPSQNSSKSSYMVPQVVDFSLSVIGQNTDLRRLPRTLGWLAPEWHDQYFQIQKARRMDLFSFGLICYWILSWDREFSHISAEEEDQAMQRLNCNSRRNINTPHKNAIDLIRSMNMDTLTLENLERLFDLTLAFEPQHRASNASQLLPLLDVATSPQPGYHEDGAPSPNIPLNRCSFRLWHSLAQLTVLDFRVRQFIFSALARSSSSTCPECAKNNALQAAICCEIAFGTDRSPEKSAYFQNLGEFDQKDISSEIQALREYRRSSGSNPLPYYVEPDLVHEYQRRSDVPAACHHLEQEILGRKFWFGDDHSLVLILRVSLAFLLGEAGKTAEAQKIQTSVFQTCERIYGSNHPETIASLSQLALLLDNAGQHTKAVQTGERALELGKKCLAEDDRYVLTIMANIALALHQSNRFEDAERLQVEVVQRHEEILGPEHPNTMRCLQTQAAILSEKPEPDLEAALGIMNRVMKTWEQTHGMQHRDTLRAQSAFQNYIRRMNGSRAAILEAHQDIYERAKSFLGTDIPDTWLYATDVAISMIMLGRSDEAIGLFQRVQYNLDRLQGPSHNETVFCMAYYADACQREGLYDQAKTLCYQIIDRQVASTKVYSDAALRSLCILGQCFYGENNYQEAKEIFEKVLAYSTDTWGSKLDKFYTREVATYLQGIYQVTQDMEKAIRLNQSLVEWANLHHFQHTLSGITYQINLAGSYIKSGRLKEALEFLPDIHQKCLQQFGPHHDVTVAVTTHLMTAWKQLGQHKEALAAGRALLATLRDTLGPLHEDTLLIMNNIAVYLLDASSFAESEALLIEIANIYDRQNNHYGRNLAMHNLAYNYYKQNKLKEAIQLQRKVVLKNLGNTTVDSLEAHYYLALYLSEDSSKFEEALELAMKVWSCCNDTHGYNNYLTVLAAELIGQIHLQKGNLDEAQASFERELQGATDMIRDNKDEWVKDAASHIEKVLQARFGEN
ncbi:hypothetical protein F4782DRAFT_245748 [Xylaria castorea]|nr:hypothetical protein F4782DRAFT_245748 [Xylaria castorea]